MFFPGECFGAEWTFVRRLARMKVYVIRQVLFAGERLCTVCAFEWSLARVLSATKTFNRKFTFI